MCCKFPPMVSEYPVFCFNSYFISGQLYPPMKRLHNQPIPSLPPCHCLLAMTLFECLLIFEWYGCSLISYAPIHLTINSLLNFLVCLYMQYHFHSIHMISFVVICSLSICLVVDHQSRQDFPSYSLGPCDCSTLR